ncbi:MAG: HNH endonuclease [Alphaproteobacteria bacterium]|nr:HNH endonuclease [Alphaproteobacteria bacterium]
MLKRDNFSCRACGASPASMPGLLLHIDHIRAWSVGGETIDDNLQTLCEPCNLGKSNIL